MPFRESLERVLVYSEGAGHQLGRGPRDKNGPRYPVEGLTGALLDRLTGQVRRAPRFDYPDEKLSKTNYRQPS
jgi:hypothetical protein